ncbi:hypothetical protein GV794_01255 [Nocardia cyriacigeorgica]|uniref:Zinc ribbon domain-containing protein n=1 Tax=Nocardia cyriacigeorgica TaxID=135487 RepID=A0ABX0CKN3_9NOCA|nr:hypothetical protein [Nocardia cyriacigeorgica]NEW54299.1 hypothetical protein [Nocardia cyriacigeorgica]
MSSLICQYCSYRATGGEATCPNCGAPLTATAAPAKPEPAPTVAHEATSGAMLGTALRKFGEVVRDDAAVVGKEAAAVERAVHEPHPRWQWQAVAAVLAVMAVLGFFLVKSCSFSISPPTGVPLGSVTTALPAPLRTAASCQPMAGSGAVVERCVIGAGDPLLNGAITAKRDLIFHARLVPRTTLNETVGQWRAAGATVVTDGSVFAAVSPSAAVQYANPSTGLLLDSGTFAGAASARTFLSRSGLLP